MNRPHRSGLLILLLWNCCLVAQPFKTYTEAVEGGYYFHRPLEWMGGRAPGEEESKLLFESLELWLEAGKLAQPVEIESFLAELPESPWAASLHASLGHHYLDHGRYSSALYHWELAYALTRDEVSDPGKSLADYTLAFWTRLLASLGRVEMLTVLYAENSQRSLDGGPLSQRWERTREAVSEMLERPGMSYKCGTYALSRVAQTLGLQYDARELVSLPSPETGFSVKMLADLSREMGLGLVPVLRESGDELVVPSVVHWIENHYAAIVDMVRDEDGGFVYKVVDPTFGDPRFLTAETINLEASGVFLVPAVGLSAGWRSLADAEAREIYGRGNPNVQGDINDQSCEIPCPPGCPPGVGPNPQPDRPDPPREDPDRDHPEDPEDCGDCEGPVGGDKSVQGMARWRVSEPYINLWLEDEPLGYQPARGRYLGLRVAYKQRDETYSSGIFNFGPGWNSSWMSYVYKNGSDSPVLAAKVLLPGGGVSYFGLVNGWSTNYHNNFRLRVLTNGVGTVTAYELHQPDGAKLVYDFFRTDTFGNWYSVFLTQWIDRHGFVTQFKYPNYNPATTVVRLGHVIDADNKTNVVNYLADDIYYRNRVGSVTDPYGRTASFGRRNYSAGADALTNIVDVAGLSSAFTYDGAGWPLTLTTPYGQTSFAMTSGTWPYLGRAIIVTEPGGSRQVYAFVQYCDEPEVAPYVPVYPANQVPTGTPVGTLDNLPGQRNSFYWNRQQSEGLPASFNDFWYEHWYWDRARLRHWLGGAEHGDMKPIDTLSLERLSSPDGVAAGQTTWLDYANKGPHGNDDKGTQIQPSVIARVMPNGSTWYQYYRRNAWGIPTNIVETYTTTTGSVATRTNTFTYTADGIDLVAAHGPSGQLLAGFSYNSYRQVLRTTNALTQVITNSYDGTWRQLTNVGQPSGLNTAYQYDSNRRLQRTIDVQINRTNSYTYHANGLVQTHTDPRALVRTFTWDNLQRLTRIDYPDSTYDSRVYTRLDLTGSRDRLGHWTYFGYNGIRQKVAETNALGTVTLFDYCGCGSPDTITEAWNTPAQRVTQFDYDLQGNRIKTYFPDGTTQTNWFNALGQLVANGDTLGQRWFGYNHQGLLTSVTNAFGLEHRTVYDIEDRPWTVMDANGVTITNSYDSLDRLLTRTAPDGGIERFLYTARGLVAYTNQLSKVWRYEYDAASRKTAETNANLEVIRYTYNTAGDLRTLTDGKNQVTTWNYDLYGRVTNKLDQASTQILRYQYDADHRLTNRWSAAKGNTAYSYNNIGNLTLVNYPVSTDITMQYDALGRVTNRVDAAGTTRYTYHANGQLLTEDAPWTSDTVTYGYNNARLRNSLSLQQPTGNWTNGFNYDAARRLSTVISPAGTYTYGYKGPGVLVTNLVLPNTSRITNAFDNVGRLTQTRLRNSGGTALNTHNYLYNQGHQRYRQTRTDSSYATYTYDNLGQLKSAIGTGGDSTENLGYAYDTAWNLSTRTNYGVSQAFAVNVKNELTTAVGLTCTYDSNGNLTYRIYDANGPKSYTYVYDDENQLIEMRTDTVYTPSGSRFRTLWTYDGLGRARVRTDYTWSGSAWAVSETTQYVYDGMRVIQERNASNTPTVSYTRGNDLSGSLEGAGGIGGLLGRSHGYSSGSWSTHNHYHADGNGNVTYLVNSGQTSEAVYRYDPYGRTMSQTGTLATANRYRFSSKEVHSQSGMYYYGFRFYEPHLQRWLNRDPIGEEGGINLYQFIHHNPNSWVDPDGESAVAIPFPGWAWPKTPNPLNCAFAAGAAAGTALCWAFPDTMTKPGEWIGNLICPMSNAGERKIQGKNPNPWKGWQPNDPAHPEKGGTRRHPQTGKKIPAPYPGPKPK